MNFFVSLTIAVFTTSLLSQAQASGASDISAQALLQLEAQSSEQINDGNNQQLLTRFEINNYSFAELQLQTGIAADVHSEQQADVLRFYKLNVLGHLNQNLAYQFGRFIIEEELNDLFQYSLAKNDQIKDQILYSQGLALKHRLGIIDQQALLDYDDENQEWNKHYQLRIGALGYGYGKINLDDEITNKSDHLKKATLTLYAQKSLPYIPGSVSWHYQFSHNVNTNDNLLKDDYWQQSIIWRGFISSYANASHDIGFNRLSEQTITDRWRYSYYHPSGWEIALQRNYVHQQQEPLSYQLSIQYQL